jgi:ferredoxin
VRALANCSGASPGRSNPAHGVEKPPQVAWMREGECIGCTKCIQACPVDAIVGASKLMHTVIADCMHRLRTVPAALPGRLHRPAALLRARRDSLSTCSWLTSPSGPSRMHASDHHDQRVVGCCSSSIAADFGSQAWLRRRRCAGTAARSSLELHRRSFLERGVIAMPPLVVQLVHLAAGLGVVQRLRQRLPLLGVASCVEHGDLAAAGLQPDRALARARCARSAAGRGLRGVVADALPSRSSR